MKPQLTHEQFHPPISIFDEVGTSPLVAAEQTALLDSRAASADKMDILLASIKWIFIFLPGATAMHFVVMMISLSIVSGIWVGDPFIQSLAAMVIFSFMILLGLGRLSDMRYLKVIGAILCSSIMSAVVFNIVAMFIGYSYYGWALLLTLPVTVLFAQLIKSRIDREIRQTE